MLSTPILESPGPNLPVELLDQIFSYVNRPTLVSLALTSHTFHGVSTRLLYRHIPSLPIRRTVYCLRALANNPELGLYVRSFEIGDMNTPDTMNRKPLLGSFYALLKRALHNMPRLTELDYLLNGPTAQVLHGAPFRLTKLTASCDFDPTFASWLLEQPDVRAALFCGKFIPGTTVDLGALPALRRVSASPLIIACVVPGRPVREVELCLVHPWLLNKEVLHTTIQIVSYSKGPLQSLQIISHLTGSAQSVLAALEVIPAGLNTLGNLALHAVSGSITNVSTSSIIHMLHH